MREVSSIVRDRSRNNTTRVIQSVKYPWCKGERGTHKEEVRNKGERRRGVAEVRGGRCEEARVRRVSRTRRVGCKKAGSRRNTHLVRQAGPQGGYNLNTAAR